MADVIRAPAAAADATKGGRVAEFDFSFGFLNAQFSDCSLVLTSLLNKERELAVLPVCSLVLASKSDYFKTLFVGGFKESVEKRRVEIGIGPFEVKAFKQLLHFIYTNHLEDNFEGTVYNYYLVASLADRFLVHACVVLCAERLTLLIKQNDPSAALKFLCIRHRHIPELKRIARASQAQFRSKVIPLLNAPKQPPLMRLMLLDLLHLFRSPELEILSEDVIAAGFMDWIEVNAPGERSLDLYANILWRTVRICELSPSSMRTLVCNTLKAMESSSKDRTFVCDSLRQALKSSIGSECSRDHAIQLATLCVTTLSQAGLMSIGAAVSFTSSQRN